MGEHDRMNVILENGAKIYFCRNILDNTASVSVGHYQYGSTAIRNIYAVVGEPLTFCYGLFGGKTVTTDSVVKEIQYDVPYSA